MHAEVAAGAPNAEKGRATETITAGTAALTAGAFQYSILLPLFPLLIPEGLPTDKFQIYFLRGNSRIYPNLLSEWLHTCNL
jgi:hypothetical protein